MNTIARLLFCSFALLAAGASAAPLDTAFSYQGELRVSGVPANGEFDFRLSAFDAAAGGSQVGPTVTAGDIETIDGVFTVAVDLGTEIASDRQLWLAIEVREGASSGGYTALSPRQKLTLAPASGFALGAGVADQALSLAAENVLMVSPSGAPFTNVAAALAAVQSPGPNNRWLVKVGPGVYQESGPLTVPGHVHLQGSGPEVTVIRTSNSAGSPGSAAASVELEDLARLSDLAVENTGTGTFGIAVYASTPAGRDTWIDNVHASAIGSGGVGHYAVYLNDAEPTIRGSRLRASGAVGFGTSVNAALGIVNIAAGFPQPLIEDSELNGGGGNAITCAGNTGTGFAIQGSSAAPEVRDSTLCGDRRAVFLGSAGNARINRSRLQVSSTSGSFLVETTGSATVFIAHSQAWYAGNKFTGAGGLQCIYNVSSGHTALSDGTTPGTACN